MKKSELRQIIKEELLKETGTHKTGNRIDKELRDFITNVVVEKSRGYVKNERDGALLLIDILKQKYNI